MTTWLFEWEWDRAWRHLLEEGQTNEARQLEEDYVKFCIAQLRYDQQCCRNFFGREPVGILLGHNVQFFAITLDRLLTATEAIGVEFVALEEALSDSVYDRVGSVVSSEFLVYQQKLAACDGSPLQRIAPECRQMMERVFRLATPLRPATRCQMVVNRRTPT